MIKTEYLLLIVFLFLLALPFFSTFVVGLVNNSTYNFFNVTNLTYFNWTTSNITIGAINGSGVQIYIDNRTTFLAPNYSQVSDSIRSDYSDVWEQVCFPQWVSGNNNYNLSFVVQNQTGTYTNITGELSAGNTENFTLSIHSVCPPGRYSGYFRVYNATNTSDNTTVDAVVDIPITVNNTLNKIYNNASFRGTMAINDSYHSFYFNVTELTENVTNLTITLTVSSDDVDIFLFDDSNNLQGRSIEKSTNDESIMDISLPTSPAMWEIRVYGNVSTNADYLGYLYYSTLNITNITYSNETIGSLDFGDLDPNTTYPATRKNYTLKNEDDRVLLNVNEYSEIYRIDTWTQQNTEKDFIDFLVPNFTQKIKVKIEWIDETGKNITDWDLYLTDPSGTLIDNSTNKFVNSNKTNATREEFILYNGPFTDKEGFWNISVRNVTNTTSPKSNYNVTVYVWVNASSWVSTDYEANFDFNSTASNASYNVSLNLTVPETEVLDGKYEGYLKYNNTEGWITRLPISFNVSAGTLIINESLKNSTLKLTDNIGFNRTLALNITFNNTGSYPIYYTNTTSNLTLTKDSNSNISFSIDDLPPNPISGSSSGIMNMSFNISTNLTGNDPGIYRGWILFNTTNSTLNSSSYPYATFNLSLEINLTSLLEVRIIDIRTQDSNNWIENSTRAENITLVTGVYLVNGTQIGDPNDAGVVQTFYVENFTSASIYEYNYTSYTSTLTVRGQQDSGNDDDLFCSGPPGNPLLCYVNYTVAADRKGGKYNVSLGVTWNSGESDLTGNGTSNDTLVIKDTGLELTRVYPSTADFDVPEGANVSYFNVSVINYGPISTSGGSIGFVNNSCAAEIDPWTAGSNCTSTESGTNFTSISVPGNASGTCTFVWKITSGTVSSTTDCEYQVQTTNTSFNSLSGDLIVTNTITTTTTVPSSSSSGGGDGDDTTSKVSGTANYLDIIDYPTSISIEQGGSKIEAVTVNNTNKTLTQNIMLTIDDLNSSWFSVNPSTTVKLKRAESYTFEVTFNIPTNATVGDYSPKFNATSLYINPVRPLTSFIYDTVLKDFTLKVTPGEALKSEIKSKLSSYTNDMNDLEQQINQSKDQNYNTSEVESLLSQLKTKIDQANDYANTGDYTSAYNLLDDIASLINQTKTGLTGLSPITGRVGGVLGDWWSWGKWVVIIVVVVVVAVLGYMFWPTKLGEPKPTPKAIVQKVVEGKRDKISETFTRLKERWKRVKEKKEGEKREP